MQSSDFVNTSEISNPIKCHLRSPELQTPRFYPQLFHVLFNCLVSKWWKKQEFLIKIVQRWIDNESYFWLIGFFHVMLFWQVFFSRFNKFTPWPAKSSRIIHGISFNQASLPIIRSVRFVILQLMYFPCNYRSFHT